MDNNLSKITVERVVEILKEDTNSGVPRLDRIKINNPDLYNYLGCPERVTKKLASDLIEWSHNLYSKKTEMIEKAALEIKSYSNIIDHMMSSAEDLSSVISEVSNFTYKGLNTILLDIGLNSKLTSRINNLKLLAVLYSKSSINETTKKFLGETLISEIYFQKSNILILERNMRDFTEENFALGLLLYNIPANPEYELDFLAKLKSHGIKC